MSEQTKKKRKKSAGKGENKMATPPTNVTPSQSQSTPPQDSINNHLNYQQQFTPINYPQYSPAQFQQPTMNIPQSFFQEIATDLKDIKQQLARLNTIEDSIRRTNNRLDTLNNTIQALTLKTNDIEESTQFLSVSVDQISACTEANKDNIMSIKGSVAKMQEENKSLREENEFMRRDIIDVQVRSMRSNLLFYGFEDNDSSENCAEKVLAFCAEKLEINDAKERIKLERAHRIGRHRGVNSKPRPIIARFNYYPDREEVRSASNKLKGTNFGVSEQFPRSIQERRKVLIPIMKDLKQRGKTVKLVRDKLFVDGVVYKEK